MKPTLLAVLVLLLVPAAAGAYQRPPENHASYVSTAQVRHDAAGLAIRTARRTGANRAEVTICRHLRQSAVDCAVRITYRDPEDGYVAVVRYVVHGIATYGGRWAEMRITSPPYFGLRDYGTGEWDGGDPACDHVAPPSGGSKRGRARSGRRATGRSQAIVTATAATVDIATCAGKCGATRVDQQIGLEPTPDEFVQALVQVFRQVGGCSATTAPSGSTSATATPAITAPARRACTRRHRYASTTARTCGTRTVVGHGDIKPKDLIGSRGWSRSRCAPTAGTCAQRSSGPSRTRCPRASRTGRPKRTSNCSCCPSARRYFYDSDAIRERPCAGLAQSARAAV
jgi:hypothetical protein